MRPSDDRATLWHGAPSSNDSAKKPMDFVDWVLLVCVALSWGTSFLLIRIALDAFKPGLVLLLRVSLGSVAIAMVLVATRGVRGSLRALGYLVHCRRAPRVIFLSLFWMGVSFYVIIVAQQWVSSALAGMLCGTIPLQVTVITAVAARKTPGARQAFGLFVGFAGVGLVLAPQLASGVRATTVGVLMVLGGTVGFAASTFTAPPLQRDLTKRDGPLGFLPVVLSMQLISTLLSLPIGLLDAAQSTFTWSAAIAVMVLGAGSTAAAFVAMAALGGRVGAVRGSLPIFFVPLVSAAAGYLVRHEPLDWHSGGGAVLIFVGALLTSRTGSATLGTQIQTPQQAAAAALPSSAPLEAMPQWTREDVLVVAAKDSLPPGPDADAHAASRA